jgi:hypothetical protein
MTGANNPDIDLGPIPAVTELSCLVIAQGPSIAGFYVASRTSPTVGGFDILSTSGNVTARLGATPAGADSNVVTGQNDGFAHTYFATWKSGDFVKLYADTPRLGGNGSGTGSGIATSTQNLKIGNRSTNRLTGFVGLVLFGTKQNIDAGLQLLENPWQIFVPQTKAIISLGSAPSESTLSADSGAYSLTGSDAALNKALALSADSGAYNLTGSDAELSKTSGEALSADSGSYSLVGSDATLNRTRSLSADSGSYNMTGSSAELTINRSLSADSGAYDVTGAAATLTQAKIISADAGSYALDGQAATFIRTYNLLAAAGAFNTTGSDASLLTSRSFSADSGAYSIDGAAATLTKVSASGYPDPSDVREGVVYGPGGIYVGTLKVGGKVLYIFDD